MENAISCTEAGQQYAAAYAAHYHKKDLRQALERYKSVIAAHQDTPEAGYSQSQIQNIVNRVVPKQALFDAQTALALAHIEHKGLPDIKPAPVTSPALERTG